MSTPDLAIDPALFDDAPTTPSAIEPDDIDVALATVVSPAPMALAEVLPQDFPLPTLIRFIPDPALKAALDVAVREAGAIEVEGPAGLQAADMASAHLRGAMRDIETHFAEPVTLANSLHKRLTGLRGEWVRPGLDAATELSRRMATERTRLERIAAEERRRQQEEANRIARAEALARAKAAEQAQAPPQVVEQMKAQAETVQAPPVPVAPVVPTLAHTTGTKTWKARVKGTPADAEPIPDTAALTPVQHLQVVELLKAIVAGDVPIVAVKLNDSYLNSRAKAEKQTLSIPGIEAFEEVGTRSKPGRRV